MDAISDAELGGQRAILRLGGTLADEQQVLVAAIVALPGQGADQ